MQQCAGCSARIHHRHHHLIAYITTCHAHDCARVWCHVVIDWSGVTGLEHTTRERRTSTALLRQSAWINACSHPVCAAITHFPVNEVSNGLSMLIVCLLTVVVFWMSTQPTENDMTCLFNEKIAPTLSSYSHTRHWSKVSQWVSQLRTQLLPEWSGGGVISLPELANCNCSIRCTFTCAPFEMDRYDDMVKLLQI